MFENPSNVKFLQPRIPTCDTFARDKMAWLSQVCRDTEITSNGFKLAYLISQYLNRQTGDAWPSQATLAKELGISVRTVRSLSKDLERRGHLRMSDGRGTSSRHYRINLHRQDGVPSLPDTKEEPDFPFTPVMRSASAFEPNKAEEHRRFRRQPISAQRGGQLPPNPMNEPFEETIEGRDSITSPSELNSKSPRPRKDRSRPSDRPNTVPHDAEFEGWFALYPKKIGKEDARRAYSQVIRCGRATHAELLAGLMRYSAERTGQDPKFTKNPAGWLNDGRWADETQLRPTANPFHGTIRPDRGGIRRPSANEETCGAMMQWAELEVPENFQ